MNECRICLEEDILSNLISPCFCRGSNKFVHKQCLDQWRAVSGFDNNSSKCPTCKFEYVLENNNQPKADKFLFFNNFSKIIGGNIILLLIFNSFLVCGMSYIIFFINNSRYYLFGHYEKDFNFDSFTVFQLSIIMVTGFYFLLFFIHYFKSNNKHLLKDYFKKIFLLPQITGYFISILLLFIYPLVSFLVSSIIINILFKQYLTYMNDLNSAIENEVKSLTDDEISDYLLSKNTQTNLEIT